MSPRFAFLLLMAPVAAMAPECAIAYSCVEITAGPGMCGDDYYASRPGDPRYLLVAAITGLAVAAPICLAVFIRSIRRNATNLCLVGIPLQVAALIFALRDYGEHIGSPFLPAANAPSLDLHKACLAILVTVVLAQLLLYFARR